MKNLIIDADSQPKGIPAPFFLNSFDAQGKIAWNKTLFGNSLYVPEDLDGMITYYDLRAKSLRPLNGNVALTLMKNQDQIPELWKEFRLLFMGAVMGIRYPMTPDKEGGHSPELWFDGKQWQIGIFSFDINELYRNHRIPILPIA